MTQGADGRNREAGFRIAGTFDAPGTMLEKAYAFTGIRALQKLLDTRNVTEVSVRLRDDRFTPVADACAHAGTAGAARYSTGGSSTRKRPRSSRWPTWAS